MRLKLITPPAALVSLAEVKAHFRVDHDDEDGTIAAYLAAAVAYIEGPRNEFRQVLNPQTWRLTLDAFPTGAISVPVLPLIAVASIAYDDADGVAQTVSAANFFVDNADDRTAWIVPNADFAWPSTLDAVNAVRIDVVCGHGRFDETLSPADYVADVPPEFIEAALLLANHYYRNREQASAEQLNDIPAGVKALLRQHKYWVIA